MKPSRARWLILAAVLLVFGRLLWADFTWWDDWHTIHQNRMMQHVNLDTFTYNWLHPSASIYIPLTFTVWGLVAMVAAVPPDSLGITLNATLFHAVNIVVHAGGALAAFGLLRRLTKNDTSALLGALFWAVHPVQVESVGWISGLKDVLSGSLVLASLLLFVRWRQDGHRWAYAASVFVYLLALLAKPSAFTMPLLVIVIDLLLLKTEWKRIALALVPFAMVTVPIAVIARLSQPAVASGAPAWVRALVTGDSLAFYAIKILFPIHLAFDYGRNIPWLRSQAELYYAWLLPVGVAVTAAVVYRRARRQGREISWLPVAGGLIFVFAPLHVLGLVPFDFQVISVHADHYLYVAVFGAAVVLAWSLTRWPKLTGLAAALVVTMGARAAWQTQVWDNDTTLNLHALRINPRSWTAYANLAVQANKLRQPDRERELLLNAVRVAPDDATVAVGLMAFYAQQGDRVAANAEARRLIDIFNRVWNVGDAWPLGAHERIVENFINANMLDDAQVYLDEAKQILPNDPRMTEFQKLLDRRREAQQHQTTAPLAATTRSAD